MFSVKTVHRILKKKVRNGMLVAINSEHSSFQIVTSVNDVESLCVQTRLYGQPSLIGTDCITLQSPSEMYGAYCFSVEKSFENVSPDAEFVLTVDIQPDKNVIDLSIFTIIPSSCYLIDLANYNRLDLT